MTDHFRLYPLDACELLRRHHDEVDLIVTDPAYACLEKHRAKGTTTRLKVSEGSSNEWFDIFPDDRYCEFFATARDALKRDAHLYMMVAPDHDQQRVMVDAARALRFKDWNPLVWNKMKIGMGYHWRSQYENILFFEKGKRKLNNLGWPNVLDANQIGTYGISATVLDAAMVQFDKECGVRDDEREDEVREGVRWAIHTAVDLLMKQTGATVNVPYIKNGYPTEKPVELFERLILNSSNPGDLVCDPFMGSGNCGVACARTGRRFLGGDTSMKSLTEAANRLSKEKW